MDSRAMMELEKAGGVLQKVATLREKEVWAKAAAEERKLALEKRKQSVYAMAARLAKEAKDNGGTGKGKRMHLHDVIDMARKKQTVTDVDITPETGAEAAATSIPEDGDGEGATIPAEETDVTTAAASLTFGALQNDADDGFEAAGPEINEVDRPVERTRLFGQLDGKKTWNKSQFEIAQEQASAYEAKKKKPAGGGTGMTKKGKKKGKKKKNAGAASDEMAQKFASGGGGDAASMENPRKKGGFVPTCQVNKPHMSGRDVVTGITLPKVKRAAESRGKVLQDPLDEDNWSMGSDNRKRMMYANMHVEHHRSNEKLMSRMQSLKKDNVAKMSPFLETHLEEGQGSEPPQTTPLPLGSPSRDTTSPPPSADISSSNPVEGGAGGDSGPGLKRSAMSQSAPVFGNLDSVSGSESPLLNKAASSVRFEGLETNSSVKSAAVLKPSKQPQSQEAKKKKKKKKKKQTLPPSPITTGRRSATGVEGEGSSGLIVKKGGILERYQTMLAEEEADKQQRKAKRQQQQCGTRQKTGGPREETKEGRMFKESFRPMFTGSTIQKLTTREMGKLKRKTHFGKHTLDAVMPLIELFQELDADMSGEVSMKEYLEAQRTNPEVAKLTAGRPDHFFLSLDKDKSGLISLLELLKAVFYDANKPSDIVDMVNFAEIVNLQLPQEVVKEVISAEKLADMKALFQLYDKDNSGGVDASEFVAALKENNAFYSKRHRSGRGLEDDDIGSILDKFDGNLNRCLEFPEFVEMFKDVL